MEQTFRMPDDPGYSTAFTGSLAHMLYRSSEGRLVMSNRSRVVNVTVPQKLSDQGGCNFNTRDAAVDAAVLDQFGIRASDFSFNEYLYPWGGGCSVVGRAILGCGHPSKLPTSGCNSWHQVGTLHIRFHELGHNLGLHHADSRWGTYGDSYAVMGGAPKTDWNALERYQMGLLADSDIEFFVRTPCPFDPEPRAIAFAYQIWVVAPTVHLAHSCAIVRAAGPCPTAITAAATKPTMRRDNDRRRCRLPWLPNENTLQPHLCGLGLRRLPALSERLHLLHGWRHEAKQRPRLELLPQSGRIRFNLVLHDRPGHAVGVLQLPLGGRGGAAR